MESKTEWKSVTVVVKQLGENAERESGIATLCYWHNNRQLLYLRSSLHDDDLQHLATKVHNPKSVVVVFALEPIRCASKRYVSRSNFRSRIRPSTQ